MFYFSIIYLYRNILPIDFHMFQDGYCTTNQTSIVHLLFFKNWLRFPLVLEPPPAEPLAVAVPFCVTGRFRSKQTTQTSGGFSGTMRGFYGKTPMGLSINGASPKSSSIDGMVHFFSTNQLLG